MELAELIAQARGDVDSAFDRVKGLMKPQGTSGMSDVPFFGQGISSGNLMGSYSMTTQAAEQYRHYTGWPYASIKIIAQRIARQAVKIARKRRGRTATRSERIANKRLLPGWYKAHAADVHILEEHPLIDALSRPNPLMIRWSLMFVTVASLLITGKNFWWIYRTKSGEVQIWPIPTHWIQPQLGGSRIYETWLIRPFGAAQAIPVPGTEIAYFHLPDPGNPLGAVSPLQAENKAIISHEFMTESQTRTFLNGHWPGLVIGIGATPEMEAFAGKDAKVVLTDAQRAQLIAAFKARYRGVYKTDEPIITDDFIKSVTRMTNTPREMDWTKSKKDAKEEITQGFGVNPISMGQVESASRNSSATADDHLCNNTVNPLIELISEFLTMTVLPMFDASEGVSAFIEEAVSVDEELIHKKFSEGLSKGGCTVNEYRENVLHLGPKANGDVFYVPMGVTPVPAPDLTPGMTPVPMENPNADQADPNAPPDDGADAGGNDITDEVEKRLLRRGARWHRLAKHVTKDTLKKVWSAHQNAAAKTFAKAALKFFDAKARETAAAVRSIIGSHGLTSGGDIAHRAMESDKTFSEALKKALSEPMATVVKIGATNEWELVRPRSAREVAIIITKDRTQHPERLRLPSTVAARVEKFADEILDQPYWKDQPARIRERIAREIDDGIDKGRSGQEVADRIEELLGDDAASRSMLITRTETTGALNAGHQATREFLAEKGLVTGKEWLCIEDDDTRADHLDANEQKVAVDEPFDVGGEECLYPGDTSLSAAQRCNCRCTSVSLFNDDDEPSEGAAAFALACIKCQVA